MNQDVDVGPVCVRIVGIDDVYGNAQAIWIRPRKPKRIMFTVQNGQLGLRELRFEIGAITRRQRNRQSLVECAYGGIV